MKYLLIFFSAALLLNCKQKESKMNLIAKIGDVGESLNFRKEELYLEDLISFTEKLEKIDLNQSKDELISLYEQTLSLTKSKKASSYLSDIQEICETSLEDLENRQEYEFGDLFLLWSDLRFFYATSKDLNHVQEASKFVTLDKQTYSELVIFEPRLFEKKKDDPDFYFLFAYKIIGGENNKTKIEFYELEE